MVLIDLYIDWLRVQGGSWEVLRAHLEVTAPVLTQGTVMPAIGPRTDVPKSKTSISIHEHAHFSHEYPTLQEWKPRHG